MFRRSSTKKQLRVRPLTNDELASVRGGDFGGFSGAGYGDFAGASSSLPRGLDFSNIGMPALNQLMQINPGILNAMPVNVQEAWHAAHPAPPPAAEVVPNLPATFDAPVDPGLPSFQHAEDLTMGPAPLPAAATDTSTVEGPVPNVPASPIEVAPAALPIYDSAGLPEAPRPLDHDAGPADVAPAGGRHLPGLPTPAPLDLDDVVFSEPPPDGSTSIGPDRSEPPLDGGFAAEDEDTHDSSAALDPPGARGGEAQPTDDGASLNADRVDDAPAVGGDTDSSDHHEPASSGVLAPADVIEHGGAGAERTPEQQAEERGAHVPAVHEAIEGTGAGGLPQPEPLPDAFGNQVGHAGYDPQNHHADTTSLPDAFGNTYDHAGFDARTSFSGLLADANQTPGGDSRTGGSGFWTDINEEHPGILDRHALLQKVASGELVADPDSRLGAYAATASYPAGTIGNSVHRVVGAFYLGMGSFGEERVGGLFRTPEVQRLLGDPVDSPSGRQFAELEHAYWSRVAAEDPWSAGGQMGSLAGPAVRDLVVRLLGSF